MTRPASAFLKSTPATTSNTRRRRLHETEIGQNPIQWAAFQQEVLCEYAVIRELTTDWQEVNDDILPTAARQKNRIG
jgi:hypothetical protein